MELVESPRAAVENADLVVTDVWSSMGHEEETAERNKAFDGYQVNQALLDFAKDDALFMHCLPAHRGEEVSKDLFEDPRSVVFTEPTIGCTRTKRCSSSCCSLLESIGKQAP